MTPVCTPAPVASFHDLKNENSLLPREEKPPDSQDFEDVSSDFRLSFSMAFLTFFLLLLLLLDLFILACVSFVT